MKAFLSLLICSVLFIGCSKNDSSPNGKLILKVSAVNGNNKMHFRTEAGDVQITDFRIAFREIKFYHSQKDTSTNGNVTVNGPFLVDLLDTLAVNEQTLDSTSIPNGDYREVRFKLHKSKDVDPSDELYNRTVYIAGTVDSIPFVMWHDTDENFDIKSSSGVVVSGNTFVANIQFDIEQFLDSKFTIDLTEATDNDNDGVIEINPWDNDGNKDIAHQMKDNIKESAHLLEEL